MSGRPSVAGPRNEEQDGQEQQHADLWVYLETVMKAVIDWDELKHAEWHC